VESLYTRVYKPPKINAERINVTIKTIKNEKIMQKIYKKENLRS